jgi:hypothetical protein
MPDCPLRHPTLMNPPNCRIALSKRNGELTLNISLTMDMVVPPEGRDDQFISRCRHRIRP